MPEEPFNITDGLVVERKVETLSVGEVQRLAMHEQRLFNKMLESKEYKALSSRLQEVMRDFPPYYMYRLRQSSPCSGLIGQIRLYHEPMRTWSEKSCHVDIYFLTEDNPGRITNDRLMKQCPLNDLERVTLCSAAQIVRMQRGLSNR